MKKYIVGLVLSAAFIFCEAQSINDFSYQLNFSQPSVNPSGDTLYVVSAQITVNDSLNVTGIAVGLGSFLGGTDIVNYIFTVGQNYGLPNNYTISTEPNKITIGLGYHIPSIYYPRIKLIDINGNESGILVFNPLTNSYTLL